MRHILQGFTAFIGGIDYGIDIEELTLPIPTPVTQEYQGGAMDMKVAMPMLSLEAMEATIKVAGQNPDLLALTAQGPQNPVRMTFRGGVLVEQTGIIQAHVCFIQGALNGSNRDAWVRGEKAGFEATINGITYLRYEVADRVIHEMQAYPPRRIVNGVDQLANLNRALGY